jgi:hypothetical protein
MDTQIQNKSWMILFRPQIDYLTYILCWLALERSCLRQDHAGTGTIYQGTEQTRC